MKKTLQVAAMSLIFASSNVSAKSELETLRALCAEQERQIKELEQENSRLRSTTSSSSPVSEMEMKTPTPAIPQKVTPPAKVPAPVSPPQKSHAVKQGETFYSISRVYGTTPGALAAANPKIKATALRPGHQLVIPQEVVSKTAKAPTATATNIVPATPTSPPLAAAIQEPAKAAPSPENKIRTVSVGAKMTFGDFASQHGTTPQRLNELNGLDLTYATVLAEGSELYVPAKLTD